MRSCAGSKPVNKIWPYRGVATRTCAGGEIEGQPRLAKCRLGGSFAAASTAGPSTTWARACKQVSNKKMHYKHGRPCACLLQESYRAERASGMRRFDS